MMQAVLAAMGESMRGDFPLSFRGSGCPPGKFGKLWCRRSVLKPVLGQNVRFLNFESQLDIHYATFCFNSAYSGSVAGKQSKKEMQ